MRLTSLRLPAYTGNVSLADRFWDLVNKRGVLLTDAPALLFDLYETNHFYTVGQGPAIKAVWLDNDANLAVELVDGSYPDSATILTRDPRASDKPPTPLETLYQKRALIEERESIKRHVAWMDDDHQRRLDTEIEAEARAKERAEAEAKATQEEAKAAEAEARAKTEKEPQAVPRKVQGKHSTSHDDAVAHARKIVETIATHVEEHKCTQQKAYEALYLQLGHNSADALKVAHYRARKLIEDGQVT